MEVLVYTMKLLVLVASCIYIAMNIYSKNIYFKTFFK